LSVDQDIIKTKMRLLFILFSLLFVAVKSAPSVNDFKTEGDALVTADLESFKTVAENKGSIKPYVENLRDYLVKGVEKRKQIDHDLVVLVKYIESLLEAVDGYIDFKKHEVFDDKLQDRILVSNTIIQSSMEWIDSRIEFVEDMNSKMLLVDIRVQLEREMKLMQSLSELGAEMKHMLLQMYSPTPEQEFADKDSILDYFNELKIEAHEILKSFYIPIALNVMERIEEIPVGLLLENDTQDFLLDMNTDKLEVLQLDAENEQVDDEVNVVHDVDDDDDEMDVD